VAEKAAVETQRMNVMLVLIWLVSPPALYVPMPDWATCQAAIVQARNELNPAHVYCTLNVANTQPKTANEGDVRASAIRSGHKMDPITSILLLQLYSDGSGINAALRQRECQREWARRQAEKTDQSPPKVDRRVLPRAGSVWIRVPIGGILGAPCGTVPGDRD
jgi:hypothetical protein